MKIHKAMFSVSIALMAAFLMWTAALSCIDLQPVGPEGSVVGLATLNLFFHQLTGVHLTLYTITDCLSLIPIGICAGFGMLGFSQLLRRKSLRSVDSDILALGFFYAAVFSVYAFFEVCIINYRPVLINGILEASYPSSTTMLVIGILGTTIVQFQLRIKSLRFRKCTTCLSMIFLVSMVTLRFLSGVHWFTDIIGGILCSAALVLLYASVVRIPEK